MGEFEREFVVFCLFVEEMFSGVVADPSVLAVYCHRRLVSSYLKCVIIRIGGVKGKCDMVACVRAVEVWF